LLKSWLIAPAVVLFGIFVSSVPGPQAQESKSVSAPVASGASNPVKPTAQSQARAKAIFAMDCAICHGVNGDGKTDLAKSMGFALDDWTNEKALATKSDGELFGVIRNGRGKMPSEDAIRAKDEEVWNLIYYIRSLSTGQTAGQPIEAAKVNN
jgi:mono/diheme cytochrome c family protein